MLKLSALLLLACAFAGAQSISGSSNGVSRASACVGVPGNTAGSYRQQCQTSTGAIYACNNSAGCTLAADWVAGGGAPGPSGLASGTLAGIPSTCTPGVSLYQATDQAQGFQLFACTAANTWTVQAGAHTYFLNNTGTANAISGTTTPPYPAAYVNGDLVTWQQTATNTSSVTMNLGPGVVSVTSRNGIALVAGNLGGNGWYIATYSSSSGTFQAQASGLFDLNGVSLTNPGNIDLLDAPTSSFNGLGIHFANPTSGNIQPSFSGTLGNGGLANPSMTFGSTVHALGDTIANFNGIGIGVTTPEPGAFTTLQTTQSNAATEATIASASTIAPTTPTVLVTGTTGINTITPPTGCTTSGVDCDLNLLVDISTGPFTLGTSGNIAVAQSPAAGTRVELIYRPAASKWFPAGSSSGTGNVSTTGTTTPGYMSQFGTPTTGISNSPCDNGVTTANTVTCAGTGGIAASAGPISSASDGVHAGRMSIIGNTTVPTLPSNSFSWIGPNSASFTSYGLQPSATGPSVASVVIAGAPSSGVSQLTYSQYLPAAQSPAFTGDVTKPAGSLATTVTAINNTSLAGLATGILKNTTATGVPSIAAAGTDYQAPVSVTTTGSNCGTASISGATLNIPGCTPTSGTVGVAVGGSSVGSASTVNFVSNNGITQSCSPPSSGTVTCSPQLNTAFGASHDQVHNNDNYQNSTNGTTALTSTSPNRALPAYQAGQCWNIFTDTANPVSINIDGVGTRSITQMDGVTALPAGTILAETWFLGCDSGTVIEVPSGGYGLPTGKFWEGASNGQPAPSTTLTDGVTFANSLLYASTASTTPRGISSGQWSTDATSARFSGYKARGTQASPTTLVTADLLTRWSGWGYDGTNYLETASIAMGTMGTIATTRVPTYMAFLTGTDAAPTVLTEAMRIDDAQHVCVGTTSCTSLLTVNGGALALSGAQSSAAWTTNGVRLKGIPSTLTDTTSSGTVAAAYTDVLGGNTVAASSATTYTVYDAFYVKAPVAGSNVTFTANYALGADSAQIGTSNPLSVSPTGYLNAPGGGTIPVVQNSQSTAYTTVLADAGKQIYHPASDNNARTFTIDSNANVAFPIGTTIVFVNDINTLTIAITSDTMYLGGTSTTGSRTLAAHGYATALKVGTTEWIISGPGLS